MRHPDYLVLMDKDAPIHTIEHLVGGEPMAVPSCSYVSREMAYQIVHEFISSKEIPESVEWVDLYEIDFDYDF